MQGFDVTITSPMATIIKAVCIAYYPDGKNEMMTKNFTMMPNESKQIFFVDP